MGFKRQISLGIISGFLLILSFPKYGVGAVAWFSLIPLLVSLNYGTVRRGIAAGFAAGFAAHIGITYWIAVVVVQYGNLPLPLGLAAMLLLAAYLGLYTSLFAGGLVYLRNRGVSCVIAAPLLWTGLEYLKSHLLTGFPWENLAYSQYLNLPLIQVADITGIYGITFTVVFINAVFTEVIKVFTGTVEAARDAKKSLMKEALCGVAVLAGLLAYGNWRIMDKQEELEAIAPFDASLIQGNIDQNVKWNPRYQRETIETYKSLSLDGQKPGPGIIVWPETAAPFYFQEMDAKAREIVRIAQLSGKWLLLGSPSYVQGPEGISFFNSAFLLAPTGEIRGRYDKVHLVPYGEYVPFRKLFPFIGKLTAGIGDFSPGAGYHPLDMDGLKIGVLICYEAIFPEAGRAYRKNGAGLLVNITNDAWFGLSSAPYQHLSMTVFRAVENRLYVLRAANTGITAIIDPTGKIVSRGGIFVGAVLAGKARFIDNRTFYVAYGDAFAYLCIFSLLVIGLITLKRSG